jgi:hypothetical protein
VVLRETGSRGVSADDLDLRVRLPVFAVMERQVEARGDVVDREACLGASSSTGTASH